MGSDSGSGAIVRPMDEIAALDVERASGAQMQVLLGPKEQMPHFYLRRFTLAPGGHIPAHRHEAIEHEQVMLAGQLELRLGDDVVTARAGDCIFIPARLVHAYHNPGDEPAVFLCAVPATAQYATEWLD